VTQIDGRPVQVITPSSPLGEALLGKKAGEIFRVELRGGAREYQVISIR
jgi:transcription elongation GreA/GreB family factor